MISVTTNNGETIVAFGYDDTNRKIWEDQTLAGHPTHDVQTDYDADGNRSNLQVPGSPYSIQYDYTQRNQLWHIYGGVGSPTWFNYSYDLAGNMTTRQDVYPGGVNDSLNIPSANYDAIKAGRRPPTSSAVPANRSPIQRVCTRTPTDRTRIGRRRPPMVDDSRYNNRFMFKGREYLKNGLETRLVKLWS